MKIHMLSVALIGIFVSERMAKGGTLRRAQRRNRANLIKIPESDFMKDLTPLDEDASFWGRELMAASMSMATTSASGGKQSRSEPREPTTGDADPMQKEDDQSTAVRSGPGLIDVLSTGAAAAPETSSTIAPPAAGDDATTMAQAATTITGTTQAPQAETTQANSAPATTEEPEQEDASPVIAPINEPEAKAVEDKAQASGNGKSGDVENNAPQDPPADGKGGVQTQQVAAALDAAAASSASAPIAASFATVAGTSLAAALLLFVL